MFQESAGGGLDVTGKGRKRCYGFYSQVKWDDNMALKKYFEDKMGQDIYAVTEKDTFRP